MAIKMVLFDLDGTLLPMDQDVFVGAYFKGLCKKLAPLGYEPDKLVKGIWGGTEAMIKNNGAATNETVFWNFFAALFGEQVRNDEPTFADFYEHEFQAVQQVCGYDPAAAATVKRLQQAGVRVALATNPIFPAVATESRIGWAGLVPEDFEWITTYENIGYSKPNPAYYTYICERLGVSPEECLMVGNDVGDDMVAKTLGMRVFLLTDNLINKANVDISQFPHGGFADLNRFLDTVLK